MKRILYYMLLFFAITSRIISYKLYMKILVAAHKSQGVQFTGMPEYIQQDAYLDASGGLIIGENTVVSTRVIILSHDWSFLKRDKHLKRGGVSPAFKAVRIGDNSFIGAGSIILPGSIIGKNCIIGAGAVVKGTIEDYSIVAGNPCRVIGDTRR